MGARSDGDTRGRCLPPSPVTTRKGWAIRTLGPGRAIPETLPIPIARRLVATTSSRGGPITPRLQRPERRPAAAGLDPQPRARWPWCSCIAATPAIRGCPTRAQQQMQAFFSGLPASPVCGLPPTQEGAGVVVARFDQMATPFAALRLGARAPTRDARRGRDHGVLDDVGRADKPRAALRTALGGTVEPASPAPS